MVSILDKFKSKWINALDDSACFGSKPPSTILVLTCIGRTKLGVELRQTESLSRFLYRKLQSAHPMGSVGIDRSSSGKGRPSTVVPNEIQSLLYSKNMSLLVPKSRKKMYAAPGTIHQNNQYATKSTDPMTTKGISMTVESPSCIALQLTSGYKPDLTTLIS
jgi:hypothetical protein